MLAFSKSSPTVPGIHYLTIFWKFHQRHVHICDTMCLCKAQSARPWVNGLFRLLQPMTNLDGVQQRTKEGNLQLFGKCNSSRDEDQSRARNGGVWPTSNNWQRLWSPWLIQIWLFLTVPTVWAQHSTCISLGTLSEICMAVSYKESETTNIIYQEESLFGVNIVERLLWKRSLFLGVLRRHHIIATPAYCVLENLVYWNQHEAGCK